MPEEFTTTVEKLIRKAPAAWLYSVCQTLRSVPANATANLILQRLSSFSNADLSYLAAATVRLAEGQMSWEALSWTLQTISATYLQWQAQHHVELLWAGPSPGNQLPARRIDQALYDLIAIAKREILLVTFAAAKIERLTNELLKAAQRGVKIRLILEFEESSEGQLSYDAMKAFPEVLLATTEVFYWPVEKRERNQAGRPGKLHAKVALVDSCALISSANLTDDAFNRNLELGFMVTDPELLSSVKTYFDSLMANNTLQLLRSHVRNG